LKRPAASRKDTFPKRIGPVSGPVRFVLVVKNSLRRNQWPGSRFNIRIGRIDVMLVERGLRIMSVEVVGDAYAIASNYLRKAGAINDSFVTDERLLQIIVAMFQRGECNKIRLANKAITQFESEFV
jgi:hypothetical protein